MQFATPIKFGILFISLMLVGCGYAEWPPPSNGLRDVNRSNNIKTTRFIVSKTPEKAQVVVVQKGDTVWGLSSRYGISMRAIIQSNKLAAPFHLVIGQRIVLPRNLQHLVAKGDTLFEIAKHYQTNIHALARLNALKPPYTILSGQRLRLPDGITPSTITKKNHTTPKQGTKQGKSLVRMKKGNKVSSKDLLPTTPPIVIPGSALKLPPIPEKGFLWPVQGPIVSSFGAKPEGFHNDGINIAAPRGSTVRAAQSGVVVYAGNELRGFGNLLLIKHSGGWVTAYAHAERLIVKRGDKVRKGQRVATVGDTGGVIRPQLHFEIRKGRHARNPRKHLRKT